MASVDNKSVIIVQAESVGRRRQTIGEKHEFVWTEVKCTACGRCAKGCPVEAITIDRTQTLTKRMRAAPCSQACPAGLDCSRYIRFVAEGKYDEATAVIRERVPFPSVLGYICKRPCETRCQRNEYEGSLLIRALKRVAAEKDSGAWRQNVKVLPATGKKVAVVGSGPAGLSTAYYLALLGHGVTVFEALPDKGGKMLSSIPEYQLPKTIMNGEIKTIESFGVDIRTNSRVESIDSLIEQGFDAAVLATGVLGWGKSLKLPIPGSRGAIDGDAVIGDIEAGKPFEFGLKTVILGGGSLAFRLALAAARGGAKEVHIFGQEHTGGLEADPFEVDEALSEGVIVHSSSLFHEVTTDNGKIKGVTGRKIRAFGYDCGGNLNWDALSGTEELTAADSVISALGQTGDRPSGPLEVGRSGVFAVGDAVNEQRSVVESVAAGRWGASMIDKYLGGAGNVDTWSAPPESAKALRPIREVKRRLPSPVPVNHVRIADGSQAASEQTLGQTAAKADAERCLKCDLSYELKNYTLNTHTCVFCGRCVENCMWNAIVPGAGYFAAADAKKKAEAPKDESRKTYGYALVILVAAVALMVAAVVISKMFGQ